MTSQKLSLPSASPNPAQARDSGRGILDSLRGRSQQVGKEIQGVLRSMVAPAVLGVALMETGGCARGYRCGPEDTVECGEGVTVEVECDAGAKDICNGIDDDCDGETDEDSVLNPNCRVDYAGNNDACFEGEERCADVPGQPGMKTVVCQPKQKGIEFCNGLDDDCNELPDDDVVEIGFFCDLPSDKICHYGKIVDCVNGSTDCQGLSKEDMTEVCDGDDNDCDGKIDESFPELYESCLAPGEQGVCADGTFQCIFGEVKCVPFNPSPFPEECDGKDNDCDGEVDEGVGTKVCLLPNLQGQCLFGEQVCMGKAGYDECYQTYFPVTENCNDGKDNDCDGKLDGWDEECIVP